MKHLNTSMIYTIIIPSITHFLPSPVTIAACGVLIALVPSDIYIASLSIGNEIPRIRPTLLCPRHRLPPLYPLSRPLLTVSLREDILLRSRCSRRVSLRIASNKRNHMYKKTFDSTYLAPDKRSSWIENSISPLYCTRRNIIAVVVIITTTTATTADASGTTLQHEEAQLGMPRIEGYP